SVGRGRGGEGTIFHGGRAVIGEHVPGGAESGRSAQGRVDTVAVGEYCCVQDHGPGAFGEGVGVQGTDASAVGVPDEGELVFTKSISQDVEVLHHVDRAHEGEEILTHHVRTAVGIGPGGFFEGCQVLTGHVPGMWSASLFIEQPVPVSAGTAFAPTYAARKSTRLNSSHVS